MGISVFAKNESGEVFHTYSCYARRTRMLNGAYHYLDLVCLCPNLFAVPRKGNDGKSAHGVFAEDPQ